jgi:hypothetical protein
VRADEVAADIEVVGVEAGVRSSAAGLDAAGLSVEAASASGDGVTARLHIEMAAPPAAAKPIPQRNRRSTPVFGICKVCVRARRGFRRVVVVESIELVASAVPVVSATAAGLLVIGATSGGAGRGAAGPYSTVPISPKP